MHRRLFLLTPVVLTSALQCTPLTAQAQARDSSKRIAVSFSKMRPGSRALSLNVGNLVPGDVSIQVELWLRVEIDPPPAGGVLVRPTFRIMEDSMSGRRPLLNEIKLQASSAPNSNEVHLTGTSSGVNHNDVFRPLWLEVGIAQAGAAGGNGTSNAAVSTIAGKDSYVVVTCS
jgi:hypothetical protein